MILLWTCLFSALGGFLFGYDLGLIGGALLQINRYFDISSSVTQELIVGAAKLGATIGTFLGCAAMARYGRQRALALSSITFTLGPLLMAAAPAPWMLIAGRLVIGLGIGMSATVSPTYIAELAPATVRGALVQLYEVMLCIGMLSAPMMDWVLSRADSDSTWRAMVGLPALPGLLLAAAPLLLPESPRWLVTHNRLDEALNVLTSVMRGSGWLTGRAEGRWSSGYARLVDKLSASRTAGQKKQNQKKETELRQCPCGSGQQYKECCGPIVAGAWARTAPELARARFTALTLGKAHMLAETTHPEALSAIGTRRNLLKKMEQLMRSRRAGEKAPALADSVHGQSPTDPDSWMVMLAVAVGPPGVETIHPIVEQYRKDNGRWWYMGVPNQFPMLEQFVDFWQRYGGEDDNEVDPLQNRYKYRFVALPPRPLSPAAAQQRPAWLSDDWPQSNDLGQDWVYLDTAVDPDTGLTAAQSAAQAKRLLDEALRDAQLDWDAYYFRFGRFME